MCVCVCVQVVYSAEPMSDSLSSSMANISSSVQPTHTTSAPVSIPAIDQASGGGGTGVGVGEEGGSVQNSLLGGQNEVATQIQNAMAGIQSQLMGQDGRGVSQGIQAAGILGQGGSQQGGNMGQIPGQGQGDSGTSSIQETMIAQSGNVGGDAIQDSIQDTILGQAGGVGGGGAAIGHRATEALLGQPGSGQVAATGVPDSSQYLNPTGGGAGGGGGGGGGGEGPTSVSDITSQLISQYVASTRPVPAVFPDGGGGGVARQQQQVENMQTDVVVPQPAETTVPPSY